jgi:hypothetical protein
MSDQNRSQSSSSSLSSEIPNPGKKAKLLLQFTERLFHDVTEDYRSKVRPICRAMTPKDSFEFRVNSELAVNRYLGGKWNCSLDRDEWKDDEDDDEDDGVSRYDYYLHYKGDAYMQDKNFKSFVEDDDRYKVKWGGHASGDDNAALVEITLRVYKDDHKQSDK